MKIIHTSDWHIGKKLHNFDLSPDFDAFIDELLAVIKRESVDVLLVSGDIFDRANPTADARQQYYQSLVKLHQTSCKIIITGGNHDAVQMLNAPQEIMKLLDIHVIGGLPQHLEELCIPLYKENKLEVLVLAVPFLRDTDYRKVNEKHDYNSRIEAIQQGIYNTYEQALHCAKEKYGTEIPIIAMGHLYTAGALQSESEREIQIGNQALFHAERFPKGFSYIALGHIHKPQRISGEIPIYYSGAPLPLSFSERNDEKRILLIDTQKGFEPKSLPIPAFRKLIRIKGTLAEIKNKLEHLPPPVAHPSLIEIILVEDVYNAQVILDLEELIDAFNTEGYHIIYKKIQFRKQLEGTEVWENTAVSKLSELKPEDVFDKLLNQQDFDEDTKTKLIEAFATLLEEEYTEE